MRLADFYAETRWGDLWNVPRPDGSHHRGHDIKAAAGETVPALRSGVVAAIGESSVLGAYLVVKINPTTFDFYCHLVRSSLSPIGTQLVADHSNLGRIAGARDKPGSAWTGPHLHYGSGPSIRSVTTGPTFDATMIVRLVLTHRIQGDPDMPELYHKQGSDPTLYALAGGSPGTPANWRETTGADLATKWAQKYGNSILLSPGTWDLWRSQFLAPLSITGGSTGSDAAAVADAVADEISDRLTS